MNVAAIVVMLLLMLAGVPLLGALIIAGLGATGWIVLRDHRGPPGQSSSKSDRGHFRA